MAIKFTRIGLAGRGRAGDVVGARVARPGNVLGSAVLLAVVVAVAIAVEVLRLGPCIVLLGLQCSTAMVSPRQPLQWADADGLRACVPASHSLIQLQTRLCQRLQRQCSYHS